MLTGKKGTYIEGVVIRKCGECPVGRGCETLSKRLVGAVDDADEQIVSETKPKNCKVKEVRDGLKMYFAKKIKCRANVLEFEGVPLIVNSPNLFKYLIDVYNERVEDSNGKLDIKDYEIRELDGLIL